MFTARIVVLCVALAGCSSSKSDAPASPPAATKQAVDTDAARALVAQGAIVIDVRTPEEFADDHLANAINIPIQDFAARLAEVEKLTGGDKTKPVVVYCASGNRAGKAKAQLDAAGYTHVVNGGGLDDMR